MMSALHCLNCGEANTIRRVSAIVNAGVSTGSSQTRGTTVGGSLVLGHSTYSTPYGSGSGNYGAVVPSYALSTSQTHSYSSTLLADALMFPYEPERQSSFWTSSRALVAGIVLSLVGVLFALSNLGQLLRFQSMATTLSAVRNGLICGLLPIAIAGLLFWSYIRFNNLYTRNFHADLQQHRIMMERWSALYYCERCDTAFNPETGQIIQVQHVQHYIHDVAKDAAEFPAL